MSFPTNFHNDATATTKKLHFCGAILHPENLSCRPDFDGYHEKNVVYSWNLGMKFKQQSWSEFIKGKIMYVCAMNMKPLYLDEAINGRDHVMKNVFEASYLTALKLHSLLASFFFAAKIKLPGNSYLKHLVLKVSAKVKRKYLNVVKNYNLCKNTLDMACVGKLVKFAFHSVQVRN